MDKFLIVIALIGATGVGVSQPAMFIIMGDMTDDFIAGSKYAVCDATSSYFNDSICYLSYLTLTPEEIVQLNNTSDYYDKMVQMAMDKILTNTWIFVGIGFGTWVCGWIQATSLMISSNRQTAKIRVAFFKAILRQDVGYFDTNSAAELNTRLSEDVKKISNGIGDKVGVAVQSLMQFIGGLIIGFTYGWKMCLVVLAVSPLLAFTGYIYFAFMTIYNKSELDAYAKAGDIAEEVLSSIRTVAAFGAQSQEVERYTGNLTGAKAVGIKKQTAMGFSMGSLMFVLFGAYGLAFWYGGTLIISPDDKYTIGQVLSAFFAVVIGAFGLSQLAPNAEYFAAGQAAAHTIYQILDRVPEIDSASLEGTKLENWSGNVKFQNVDFTYPARLDQQILKSVSFEASPGQTVALCGESGSGKSTCIQLLQRFYDTRAGTILFDGVDIKDINIEWLRANIGMVSQEPILFDASIRENVKMGKEDASEKEIDDALREAHAYDFVQKLPQKLETNVGESGATLSGGQKQRIAIARALIRNPTLLLLDEATSALDTESERLVQKALDSASKDRTTIVIAHRLSTIKNADKIIGFSSGQVVEEGTHASLLEKGSGVYANLCNLQSFARPDMLDEGEEAEQHEEEKTLHHKASTKKSKKDFKSSVKKDTEKDNEDEEDLPEHTMSTIYKLNRPELCYNIFGSIFALALGSVQPLYAIVFPAMLSAYGTYACSYDHEIQQLVDDARNDPNSQINQSVIDVYDEIDICQESLLMKEIVFWTLMFLVLGIANLVGYVCFSYLFGVSGEELTMRLRTQSFKKLLELEIGYFDDPVNSTGAITTRLSSDAAKVQGAIGSRLGSIVMNIGSLGCAFIIAFYYEWRITLVSLAFIPPLIVSMAVMMSVFTGGAADKERKAFEDAGQCTTEATMNIRTVAAFGRENFFVNFYEKQLQFPLQQAMKKTWIFGFMYGMSLGLQFLMFAGTIYFGSWLIQEKILPASDFDNIFRVLFALLMGAMTAGQAGAMVPNFGEAKTSANRILKLLDQKSSIDPSNEGGKRLDKVEASIKFTDVNFVYPTRPNIPVLSGLTLEIEPGETVALVGESGCGKSTCIQLAERFYDGTSGSIELDGIPLNQLNVQWLRRQIGFVQQEPTLFNTTIKENILYGNRGVIESKIPQVCPDQTVYSDEDIKKACAEANALKFIEGLPRKFETSCGKKGSQLSGGQKQRIAIARALIRNPKLLLFDEATSALDTESEKIVQDALNRASEGRTCIIIAHRLSTVINADKIAVIDNGIVVEIGKHDELIAKKGAYYSLVNNQL